MDTHDQMMMTLYIATNQDDLEAIMKELMFNYSALAHTTAVWPLSDMRRLTQYFTDRIGKEVFWQLVDTPSDNPEMPVVYRFQVQDT